MSRCPAAQQEVRPLPARCPYKHRPSWLARTFVLQSNFPRRGSFCRPMVPLQSPTSPSACNVIVEEKNTTGTPKCALLLLLLRQSGWHRPAHCAVNKRMGPASPLWGFLRYDNPGSAQCGPSYDTPLSLLSTDTDGAMAAPPRILRRRQMMEDPT